MNDTQSWNDLADLEKYVPDDNLLILDSNNLGYRWIGRSNYSDFENDYIRTIQSLAKSYRAKRTICCWDFGKSYHRKNIFPEYKDNRTKPTDPEEAKKYEEFFTCLNQVADNLPTESYKFRGVEADDLITYFVENLKNEYEQIWIVSSDKDLFQLLDDNIFIFNLYSRKEISIDTLLEDIGVTPDEFLLAKIIQGDKGDNISGIAGIGDKRSAFLAREYKTLENLLQTLPIRKSSKYIQNLNAGKETLLLNEKLINLKRYNKEAIMAGKEGENSWKTLEGICRK